MLRCSFLRRAKVSAVATQLTGSSSLTYEKQYRMPKRMTLSKVFNTVSEENRYTSLKILLERLSSYVGRRQYKLQSDLSAKCLERLQTMRLDWHDIKQLPRHELISLLGPGGLELNHAERAVFLAATTPKVCGVLRKGIQVRHTENICMNPGLPEHGWRCGRFGHTRDVYFEGKMVLNPHALAIHRRPSSLPSRVDVRNGLAVEVRPMPDFSIAGRLSHEINPRIWSNPSNAVFDVHVIGYEFRVHPEDPRAVPQIVKAADEWYLHAEAVRHVLWEMIELYGVEKPQQPMVMQPYELGEPDQVNTYSSAFARRRRAPSKQANEQEGVREDAPIRDEDVVVEPLMSAAASGDDPSNSESAERSWFTPPLPQRFTEDGVPEVLPFAPTFMVQCTFKPVEHVIDEISQTGGPHNVEEVASKFLLQPVVEISCLTHPNACYWLSDEDEAKAMAHIVSFAKRVPFAIPFNLYLRVDPSKLLRGEAGTAFRREREELQQKKARWFDLSKFVEVHTDHGEAGPAGTDRNEHADFDVSEGDEANGNTSSASDFFYGSGTQQQRPASRSSAPDSSKRKASDDDDEFTAAARAVNPPGWL